MRWATVLGFLALASTCFCADEKTRSFRFSKADIGKVPSGWKAEKTGRGEGSVWQVVEDETAPSKSGYALAQTAKSPGGLFNICVALDTKYKDVELSVSFKAIAGDGDQGGGFVWRYKDNNNYYVCRMNPLEDNYRVYKVVAGKRIQLGTKEGLRVRAGEWHKLTVKMVGNHIECSLDGKKLLDVRDDAFQQTGRVGLWTKADAQTFFDN